jgi:branched-chain amino acid transport system ATP-binding protein
VRALDDVTVEVHAQEVLGLIGPNGAGKTTLVNILAGFDMPNSGRVELSGRDITRWRPDRRGRNGLARTFQHGHLFRQLTVRENIEVAALAVGASMREAHRRADSVLRALNLVGHAERQAGTLPHGDERRLGVARALAMEPRFVLLDEPAAGLPEAEVPDFVDVIRGLREVHGAGVLLIDHNVALIMEVCDRVHVLDQGRTLAAGTPEEIRRNLDVATAYLGAGASAVETADA